MREKFVTINQTLKNTDQLRIKPLWQKAFLSD
jgi:hypothetical protein